MKWEKKFRQNPLFFLTKLMRLKAITNYLYMHLWHLCCAISANTQYILSFVFYFLFRYVYLKSEILIWISWSNNGILFKKNSLIFWIDHFSWILMFSRNSPLLYLFAMWIIFGVTKKHRKEKKNMLAIIVI